MQVPTTSDHALRGDYSAVGPDMTIAQDWGAYTPAEHGLWRWLHDRQAGLMRRYAAGTVTRALARLDYATAIPDLEKVSASLRRATGWRLVAVPGLIPDEVLFTSGVGSSRSPRTQGRGSVTSSARHFHDMAMCPVVRSSLRRLPCTVRAEARLGTTDLLARVYWYTVEFGLVREAGELRAFGAGILSSFAETQFSIDDPAPNRVGFVLERVLRTEYRIDDFQQTYFVLEDFDQLFRAIQRDFRPLYADTRAIPRIGPFELAEDDILLWRGRGRRHPTGSIQDNVTGIGPGHR
jgi:phenylalanine-4-hydroxylase